jgi:hypothetical protein
MIPNRSRLLLTGDLDAAGLDMMLTTAEANLSQPRPLSPQMMRLEGGRWVEYRPAQLSERLTVARFHNLKLHYDTQKKLMDDAHKLSGKDVFVASFKFHRLVSSGELISECTLTKNIPSFLPRTSHIMLMNMEMGIATLAPWDAVQRICGGIMRETEHIPLRYWVDSFPNDEQFSELVASSPLSMFEFQPPQKTDVPPHDHTSGFR